MILPYQLAWIVAILLLGLLLVVLFEIQRSNYRREHEEMFGTKEFDTKVALYDLTPKEIRTLEKLVRASKFENKDAVLNSSHLFEAAVLDFYEMRDVDTIRDETLDAVTRLRQKLGFDASNPLTVIVSTRQFNIGNRVDLLLDGVSKLKHSEILSQREKIWKVSYDDSFGPGSSYVGKEVRVRWTRPEDAVYSTNVRVFASEPGKLVLRHGTVRHVVWLIIRTGQDPIAVAVDGLLDMEDISVVRTAFVAVGLCGVVRILHAVRGNVFLVPGMTYTFIVNEGLLIKNPEEDLVRGGVLQVLAVLHDF